MTHAIQKPIEIPLALPMEVGGGDDDLPRPPCPNRTGERRRLARSGRWPLRWRAAGSRHSQLNDPRPDLTAIHSAIKERVRSIGGALAIESAPGQGARVEVWVSREALRPSSISRCRASKYCARSTACRW